MSCRSGSSYIDRYAHMVDVHATFWNAADKLQAPEAWQEMPGTTIRL